ncbi:MAG: hypothetical protein WBV78_18390 [Roseobacter sp.]
MTVIHNRFANAIIGPSGVYECVMVTVGVGLIYQLSIGNRHSLSALNFHVQHLCVDGS